MHVLGRRIDIDNHSSTENVFVSCVSSDTSIGVTISNFSYENVQDYTCLEDQTQESNHTWLITNPDLEIQGIITVGAQIRLTCNSFYGAPIYWILPGSVADNADVKIQDYINDNNASSSATFKLEDSDNFAEYRCCIATKTNQQGVLPCSSYTFLLDDAVQLISTYENYRSQNEMKMQCVFRGIPTPDPNDIQWQQCSSTNSCTLVYASYYNSVVDEAKNTVNSSLKISYSSTNNHYICSYGNINHTFVVDVDVYAPEVVPIDKQIFYSTSGYAVTLGCLITASPSPNIVWTKTIVNAESDGFEIVETSGNYMVQTQQLSDDQWQTQLYIFPYDVNNDNAFFTCTADNDYGQRSEQMDTTEGPNNFNLHMETNVNATVIWGVCSFQMFPYPPTYEISVLSACDISFNTTVSQDEELSQITSSVVFDTKAAFYPITIQCSAFNRFDPDKFISNQFVIVVDNFTTTLAPTKATTTK